MARSDSARIARYSAPGDSLRSATPTGGELGTRLTNRIGFHTSPNTILGRIMALASCSFPTVSCLGIDDWSFRRGPKFGTILVDLTTHTIIDLLPDRYAETSVAWMRDHPEIEIVSRDRGEEYAAAARAGAPQAIQCMDRFHLARHAERSDRYQ